MSFQAKQTSFAAGEIASEYYGHDEYRINQTGLARCRGYVVRNGGGLTRRPPLHFIAKAKPGSILIGMNIAADDSFVIEMYEDRARFFRDNALLLDGAIAYTIAHPYLPAEFKKLRWQKSGDVLWLTHPARGIWKFARLGNIDWTSHAFAFKSQPFRDENIDEAKTITASAPEGVVTLTATGFVFTANMVGSQLKLRDGDQRVWKAWEPDEDDILQDECRLYNGRLYKNIQTGSSRNGTAPPIHLEGVRLAAQCLWQYVRGEYGIVEITAVAAGGATATGTVKVRLPEEFCSTYNAEYGGAATSWRWAEQAFSAKHGWPDNVWLHQQRLYFSKGPRVWYSAQSDYVTFTAGPLPSDPGSELVGSTSGQADDIQWASSGKVLALGCTGEEYSWSAASIKDGVSPTNLRIDPATLDGSSAAQAARVRSAVLHLNQDGTKLFEMIYNFQIDDFDSEDRALPSEHMLALAGQKLVYQRNPYSVFWILDGGGRLISFTYVPKQEIFGWALHPMADTVITDGATVYHPFNGSDDVWLRVQRTICGQLHETIELMGEYFNREKHFNPTLRPYLDGQRTAAGDNIKLVAGLGHLAGAEVRAVSNLGDEGLQTVSPEGTIKLCRDCISRVVIGLPARGHIRLLPPPVPAEDGSTEGRLKNIKGIKLRGRGGPGGLAGDIDEDHDLAEAIIRASPEPGQPVSLDRPDQDILIDVDWTPDGMLDLWTDGPYPLDIVKADRVVEQGGH